MSTKLDFQQVIKKVYDEPENRLRVDAALTMTDVVQEVLISAENDSVQIGDGDGNFLAVNPDGSLNVVIDTDPAIKVYVLEYNEISSVPAFTETPVITYTVPSGKRLVFASSIICVNADTDVRVKIEGATKAKQRSNWTQRNIEFKQEFTIDEGEVLSITVVHQESNAQSFEANISGNLVDM